MGRQTSGPHVRDRVRAMIEMIRAGSILEAMREFYHADTSMQENRNPPMVGLEANIKREQEFLAQVRQFRGFGASAIGIDGGDGGTGTALIESWMEYTGTDGQLVRSEQVSVQRWRGGKIASERFYYDSAG